MRSRARGRPGRPGTKPASLYGLQVDAITAAAMGEDVPYATGQDGARTIDVLEAIAG